MCTRNINYHHASDIDPGFICTTAPISVAGYSVIGWNHPGFGDSSVSHGYGSVSLYADSFYCMSEKMSLF